MASINAVIVPAKVLRDGRHKIRIAVAHNGETRYIVTDITVDSSKEFRNGTIVKRPDAAYLNTKLRGLIQHYQEILDEVQYTAGLKCAELVTLIKETKTNKNCTLATAYKEYIETSTAKPSSLYSYRTAWNTITKHINPNMLIAHVTYGTIVGLEKSMRDRHLSNTTIHNYIGVLSSVIGYAKKCGYVYLRTDPFIRYSRPASEVRQAWLSVEEIKRLRDAKLDRKCLDRCRNLIMLSYYLGGINITDLMDINFKENADKIRYIRKKTKDISKHNPFIEFDIPDEAKVMISKLIADDGFLRSSRHEKKDKVRHTLTHNTRDLAKIIGVPRLIYYSARKSFSQHAFELGIETSVIDYILGHSLKKDCTSLFHYVYITPEMATKAIRKVLDNLK